MYSFQLICLYIRYVLFIGLFRWLVSGFACVHSYVNFVLITLLIYLLFKRKVKRPIGTMAILSIHFPFCRRSVMFNKWTSKYGTFRDIMIHSKSKQSWKNQQIDYDDPFRMMMMRNDAHVQDENHLYSEIEIMWRRKKRKTFWSQISWITLKASLATWINWMEWGFAFRI